MTDFEAEFASSLDSAMGTQADSDAVEERLQRVQGLEQARLDRNTARNPPPEQPNARLSIRDRIVQMTQSQRPSAQRRAREHPRRSASFHTGDTNIHIAQDIQNFREAFETSRSNIFGSAGSTVGIRRSDSGENIRSSQVGRRTADLAGDQDDSQPNSGSSTPRISRRGQTESAEGSSDPFASIVADLSFSRGSNSNLSDSGERGNGTRSSSATREGRNNTSTNYQRFRMSNPSDIALSARNGRNEARRSRMTERRRQTIGVTTADVREAMALNSGSSGSNNQSNSSDIKTRDTDNGLSRDSFQYSSFRSNYSRKIEIFETNTRPVLALSDEAVVYIDDKGHSHWLEKSHPLLKATKDKSAPSVVINYKSDCPTSNSDTSNESVIDIPGDPEERYGKLRELIKNSKSREGSCGNNNGEEISNGNNGNTGENENIALDDTDSNIKKFRKLGIDLSYTIEAIEERFKHVSYYTKPRPRPDLNSFKLTRKCKSIYDYESSEQSENTNDTRTPSSRLDSILTSAETSRPNGLHITVTDTAETPSVVNTIETVTETREQINPVGSLTRSNFGTRSESALLTRSTSVQESRSSRFQYEGTPTGRLVRHGSLESRLGRQGSRHEDVLEEAEEIRARLQQRHAYAQVPIDTSQLDIEEMRMIQKALEENPSPPPSPTDFEVAETDDTFDSNYVENNVESQIETSDTSADVVLEPVVDVDHENENTNGFCPLSPVQEANESESGTPGPDSAQQESVHTVFNEFVTTANEEHVLNLPRGYIFGNR